MGDGNFAGLARQRGYVRRAAVGVGMTGAVATPSYGVGEAVRLVVQPARGDSHEGLLGMFPEMTHVGYVAAGLELEPGDVVAVVVAEGLLARAVVAGAGEIEAEGVEAGAEIVIGEGTTAEVAHVRAAEGGRLWLRAPLKLAHGAMEPVGVVRQCEVLAVEDAAGRGHHLRLALRERVL